MAGREFNSLIQVNEINHLRTARQAQDAVAVSDRQPVFIFKHSTQCGVSARAIREFQAFVTAEPPGFAYFQVDVPESRPASDELETLSLVRHESPQVLLMRGEECLWHASHGAIKAAALAQQAAALRDSPAAR